MDTTTRWIPEPETLPWDPRRGGLLCPGCPEHPITSAGDRYELVMERAGREDGKQQHDTVRVTRRAPGLGSGPFDIPTLPSEVPIVAIIDYLERQTFEVNEVRTLLDVLRSRYPDARLHVWPIGAEITRRIAEDAYWDAHERVLIRAPVVDIEPHEYPMDVGWRQGPERVAGRDGGDIELWRGSLYVDPDGVEVVRHGWSGLEAWSSPSAPAG